ncbi:MAG: SpoIIE family protein phosphatase [Bacteroidales bacterium]|nr:SpoIIE family protein phosphatase [Bacteroidales bacterium]
MRKFILLVSFLLVVSLLKAQQGAPLLTHFYESRDIENQNWAICQDEYNVMLFANRKGISAFDGQDWTSVRIPVIPYTMRANPKDGKIFVGGENNYGYIEKDQAGLYKYISVSGDEAGIGVITRIIFNDSVVWFYGEQSVSRHNLNDNKLELRLKSPDDSPFTGMFVTPKNTFINRLNSGLFRLESDTLFPIVTGYLTENIDILFSLPYDQNRVLVGLSNGKLQLFDGIKYYDYQVKDEGYLRDNILSEGIMMGDSLYAFSTLDGGALVIDKKSGEVRFTINNQNKLPDDEIYAIGQDRSGGLWLSHQYGLSRAELKLPVGNFSIYPGLTGNLTTSLWFKGELFVGTSEGVYYLTAVRNYAEVQVLVKNDAASAVAQTVNQSATQEQQGTRKSIFTRIFGKKITKEKSSEAASPSASVSAAAKKPAETFTKKTVNKLKSINYIYKRVDGFNEKCRQLVATDYGILAATNKGLLVINNHKAETIAQDRYVNFISWQPVKDRYYIASGDGYFSVRYSGGKWISESPDPAFSDPVYSLAITSAGDLWLGVDNAALLTDLQGSGGSVKYTSVSIKSDFPQRYLVDAVNDSVFLYTESGVYYYQKQSAAFVERDADSSPLTSKTKFAYPLSNKPWVKHGYNWLYLNTVDSFIEKEMSLLKLFSDVVSINTENKILWVVDGENRLFRIDMDKPLKVNPESNILVKSIYNANGTTFSLSEIVFNRGDNVIYFDIVAPGYLKQNTTQYQYTVNKLMNGWSNWSVRTSYNLAIPIAGDYTLQVRAKDIWGNIGDIKTIKFTIKAPFTKTPLFFILTASFVLLILFLIVRFREGQLQKANKILEQKVKERTAEIEAQKEEITSSIEYASRIQMAMLPEEEHFKSFFSDHFIIFKPRDIVSGDFYWIGETEKQIFFTVADCTGHGVPGAFMSTLGISTLNEIITNNSDLQANTVLGLLREKIKTSLHQTGKEGEAADGMDISFCIINKSKKVLQYSGAYNPLFIFQGGEFKEYKADRMPIGIYYGEKKAFTNYEINLKKGDAIYIFSDGYADQFGGPDGVKYKSANLKKLLADNYYRPMSEQKAIIEKELENWKGSADQVDDITMIGIRI